MKLFYAYAVKNSKLSKQKKLREIETNFHMLGYIYNKTLCSEPLISTKLQHQLIKQWNQHPSTTGNLQNERQMKNQPYQYCLLYATCAQWLYCMSCFSLPPPFLSILKKSICIIVQWISWCIQEKCCYLLRPMIHYIPYQNWHFSLFQLHFSCCFTSFSPHCSTWIPLILTDFLFCF